MLRIFSIPSLLWLCIGCYPVFLGNGVGYYDPFPSSSTARQIEQATGSRLSGGDGAELGVFCSYPLIEADTHEGGLYWVVELKSRFITGDGGRLDGVTAGLGYCLRVNDKKADTPVFLTGGLGVGWHELVIEGLLGDTAWGGHASIGFSIGGFTNPFSDVTSPLKEGVFVEARYQLLDFDTAYGELDARGFEVVVGMRLLFLTGGLGVDGRARLPP